MSTLPSPRKKLNDFNHAPYFTPSEVPHLDRYYEKAFKELLSVKSTSKRYFKQNDPIIQCVDESIRELKQAREKMLARSKE